VVHGAHLFVLSIDIQVGLGPVALEVVAVAAAAAMAKNGTKFSQCNVVWGGFPCARG
jgi:hypothetical protein